MDYVHAESACPPCLYSRGLIGHVNKTEEILAEKHISSAAVAASPHHQACGPESVVTTSSPYLKGFIDYNKVNRTTLDSNVVKAPTIELPSKPFMGLWAVQGLGTELQMR